MEPRPEDFTIIEALVTAVRGSARADILVATRGWLASKRPFLIV
jgi:hypothetical protein